jgi:uncharacterized protein YndB with AHSA1/START domain
MIKTIFLVIAAAIAGVLVYAAMQPDSFAVQRSITIAAPPERVHGLIDDFKRWSEWSPWEKLDPALKRTHSGAPSGKGAIYAWEGNKDVGSGRMEVTDSVAPGKVVIKLDFIQPFEAHNITEFTLAPQAGGTQVTWKMQGPSPYVTKLMQVFVSMDKMVGKDFEAGLANMKAVAEKP